MPLATTLEHVHRQLFHRYPGNGTIGSAARRWDIYNPAVSGRFTPKFSGDVTDASIVAGMRASSKWLCLHLSRFGDNEIDYSITDTINPSLGPLTTSSNSGRSNEEFQVQLDFSQNFVGAAIL